MLSRWMKIHPNRTTCIRYPNFLGSHRQGLQQKSLRWKLCGIAPWPSVKSLFHVSRLLHWLMWFHLCVPWSFTLIELWILERHSGGFRGRISWCGSSMSYHEVNAVIVGSLFWSPITFCTSVHWGTLLMWLSYNTLHPRPMQIHDII